MAADLGSVLRVHGTGLYNIGELRLTREHTSSEPHSVSLDNVLADSSLDGFTLNIELFVQSILTLVAKGLEVGV